MKRRDFITLLGGAVAAWPLRARAQQPGRIYRLGILTGLKRDSPVMIAFFEELGRLGKISCRLPSSSGKIMLMPVVLPSGRAATRTMPIVGGSGDMQADGLVDSLGYGAALGWLGSGCASQPVNRLKSGSSKVIRGLTAR